MEPWKAAAPKEKMPPSDPTSQYPRGAGPIWNVCGAAGRALVVHPRRDAGRERAGTRGQEQDGQPVGLDAAHTGRVRDDGGRAVAVRGHVGREPGELDRGGWECW